MSHYSYPKRNVPVRSVSTEGRHGVRLSLSRYELLDLVVDQLKACRDNCKTAKAPQARRAIARAMKSVEGARRHAKYHGWGGR